MRIGPIDIGPASRMLGRLVLVLAGAQLLPLLCALLYGEGTAAWSFAGAAAITALAGGAMMFFGRGQKELYRREGILIVTGGWFLASVFGALPYVLSGAIAHPVDAIFEAASGFTTTGASVLTDIAALDHGILFWRSFTQWLGGMGIIVLFVALLPELGPGARFLYKLEVPGPTAETLSPRIRDTAAVLWRLYLGFTVVQTSLLWIGGMTLFDALTHTFATLSTGGFSPHNDSVAGFMDQPWLVIVIIVFMILAGGNFSLYYGLRLVLANRPKPLPALGWRLRVSGFFQSLRYGLRRIGRDPEFRLYLLLIFGVTAVISVDLVVEQGHRDVFRVLLDALFQVSSLITTTGFATADYDLWPNISRILLVALMFVGGCAGSTSGSMKVMRMVIGLRSALHEVRSIFSPNTVSAVFVGGKAVPGAVVRSVSGFFILFLTAWGIGTLLLTLEGSDLETAATACIATLGNVGPGLSDVGPTQNFAFYSAPAKLLMVLLMVLGRLEVYALAAIFHLRFWRD